MRASADGLVSDGDTVRWSHRGTGKAARPGSWKPSPSPSRSLEDEYPRRYVFSLYRRCHAAVQVSQFPVDAGSHRRLTTPGTGGPLGARCIHMGLGVFLPLYGPCTVAIHVALGSAVCFTYHKDVPHLRGHAVSNYRDAAALIPRTRQKCCSNGPQINGACCPGLIIIAAIYVLARRGHAVRAFIYEVVQLFI